MSPAAAAPRIAIIGAGSSGLAAARVFSRNGLQPIVLEKDKYVGGIWKYEPNSKTRPMYRGLRTNLPKEIMAFREFPFPKPQDPSFLPQEKVQEYLEAYRDHFDLTKYIHYGCEVTKVEVLKNQKSLISPESEVWPQIRLEWKDSINTEHETKRAEVFDVVCICNGHYSRPALATIPGLNDHFRGSIMHSIEYDNPADFKGQTVLCVGGRASGSDLARELAPFCKHVYLSDSTCPNVETQGNITWVPATIAVNKDDGSIVFDKSPDVTPTVDCIIFCTGYDYEFPFIHDPEILQCQPGERRVTPLFHQLWHAQYPTIAFLGIPHSVVPFPEVELQAEAIHAQFENCNFPSQKERTKSAQKDATSGGCKDNGRVPQDTHYLGPCQWDYERTLAKLAGIFDQKIDNFITTNQVCFLCLLL